MRWPRLVSRICRPLFTQGSLIPILPTSPLIPGGKVKRSEPPQPPQAGCDLLALAGPQSSGRRVLPLLPALPPCRRFWPSVLSYTHSRHLSLPTLPVTSKRQSPTLSGNRDRFRGRQFSHRWQGVGFWMIQVHYNDCAPFFSFVAISGYPALT